MEKDVLEKYEKAGKIHKEVAQLARGMVKDGASVLDFTKKIEDSIKAKGGGLAFPLNVSINDITAHYTPDFDDTLTFNPGDLVKVDIGVQIDGYIADGAFSVLLGENSSPVIKASEDAVEQIIKNIAPGKTVSEMSQIIEEVVSSYNLNPVRNLAGHSVDQYIQHGGLSIPNGKTTLDEKIPEDTVLGMEVFVTDGEGWVKESSPTLIYMFLQPKPVRLPESRKILQRILTEYQTLPFAKRWLSDLGGNIKISMALRELASRGVVREYPPLREKSGRPTAQTEHT
ncbi:type II methionyl aminopeptidase, partial [Candidatus Micrarchaeota archaeon RBG_16_49_10]